jgi:acetoin utilization deacetylase AcuC-like enzyme
VERRRGACPRARPEPPRGAARGGLVELLSNDRLARLHPTGEHPENGRRIRALLDALPIEQVTREATDDELLRCHDTAYLARLRAIDRPVLIGLDTVASETTMPAATLAAGIAFEAVERGAFALVRPPGHHATRDTAMGFCFLNHVALAARHARTVLGAERVAIVDWDVHHGNGTSAIFWDDPSVLFVSLHQYGVGVYPGTGGPHDQNESTLNVPLPPACDDDDYGRVFAELVEPRVRAFAPDLLLVSAGFDAHVDEPLEGVGMRVTDDGFRQLAAMCAALAPRCAAFLEGGYNVETLPGLVAAAAEALAG